MNKKIQLEKSFIGQLFRVADSATIFNLLDNNEIIGRVSFANVKMPFLMLKGEAYIQENELDILNSNNSKWYLLYQTDWFFKVLYKDRIYIFTSKKINLIPCFGNFEEQFLLNG